MPELCYIWGEIIGQYNYDYDYNTITITITIVIIGQYNYDYNYNYALQFVFTFRYVASFENVSDSSAKLTKIEVSFPFSLEVSTV